MKTQRIANVIAGALFVALIVGTVAYTLIALPWWRP